MFFSVKVKHLKMTNLERLGLTSAANEKRNNNIINTVIVKIINSNNSQ